MTDISKNTKKQRNYYEKNRESWNAYQRAYKKRKYKNDPVYRERAKEYARKYREQKKIKIMKRLM